jgi:hypothetical protein
MQTILDNILAIIIAGATAVFLAFWAWLRAQIKGVPKLLLAIAKRSADAAKLTPSIADDVGWKLVVGLLEAISAGMSQTLGTRSNDVPTVPSTGVTITLDGGKQQPDRRATLPAEVVAAEARVACGKQTKGGTGRCTLLPDHSGSCASAPMTQAVFPHHTPR